MLITVFIETEDGELVSWILLMKLLAEVTYFWQWIYLI